MENRRTFKFPCRQKKLSVHNKEYRMRPLNSVSEDMYPPKDLIAPLVKYHDRIS